jgi:hypothetical protein
VEVVAVIIGVILFLWSTAVIVTGCTMLMTDGRIGRREWYLFATAVVVFLGCIIAYTQMGTEVELPPPVDEKTPAIP